MPAATKRKTPVKDDPASSDDRLAGMDEVKKMQAEKEKLGQCMFC